MVFFSPRNLRGEERRGVGWKTYLVVVLLVIPVVSGGTYAYAYNALSTSLKFGGICLLCGGGLLFLISVLRGGVMRVLRDFHDCKLFNISSFTQLKDWTPSLFVFSVFLILIGGSAYGRMY